MSKIVITGGTGMIATALAEYAISVQDEVILIVRPNSQRIGNIPQGVKLIECELKDYKDLQVTDYADIFFHLAWDKTSVFGRDDAETQTKNIEYTLDAVNLANRFNCKVFVGAGSQAEYGVKSEPLTCNGSCNAESGYGIAKYSAGKLSYLLCDRLGIRHNWGRILSIYGKNDGAHTLISYLINAFSTGETPKLTKCEQIWDYMYVSDCAKALYLIGQNGVHGKAYPIGSGKGRELKDYVLDIKDIINPDAKVEFGAKDYYPHQPMYLVADISELTRDTGFIPSYEFKNGIKEIIKDRD